MQVERCLHTAILVTDLDQAAHFYGTVLNLPLVERPLSFPGLWYEVAGYQVHIMVATPDLLPQASPDNWGRNRHLALRVQDLEAAKQHLTKHQQVFRPSSSGRAALFVRDPDGNVIELQG
jgi:glyoxylase I family protein